MIKNYLKIAWRNLIKGKLYSTINIVGLAVGIAACLLIGLYVYEEFRFDRFHENSDRIYRVNYRLSNASQAITSAWTPNPLGPYLKDNYPQVEQVVSLKEQPGVVRVGNVLFEQDFLVTEPSFFELFDFTMLSGNPAESLVSPGEVLLTRQAAQKFYGDTDVIGRPIELRIDTTFYQATVTGVVEEPPQYSSIQFSVLVSQTLWNNADPDAGRGNNWGTLSAVCYALLDRQADPSNLATQVTADIKEQFGENVTAGKSLEFQSLADIHFAENVQFGLEPSSNVAFVSIAALIAVLILIIACINFTSLSLGQSVRRAREVGMRKTMGAGRRQLMAQFWGETLLVVLFAFGLGLLLTELLLPHFGPLVNRSLDLNILENPFLVGIILGILLLTGLMAGSYPALFLSSFLPRQIFQHQITVKGNFSLIRILTGVQFCLAVTLIIGTMFMHQQMNLMLERNPGFDQEYVVHLNVPFEEGRDIMEQLQTSLQQEPSIVQVSGGWNGLAGNGSEFNENPITSSGTEIQGFTFGVDPGLPELLNLKLIEGRFFRESADLNSPQEVIVNQELVKAYGWEDPLGKRVSSMFNFSDATVVGVVQNFHFQSMHHPIAPLVIYPNNYVLSIYAKIQGHNVRNGLTQLEAAWQTVAPGLPFNYQFLDQQVEQQYRADQRWASIVELASYIAIVLSCMGLFGLSALATAKRNKEIAVRKIVGATVTRITTTLSKDFLKPVTIGILLAVPLAYFLLTQWLANFAYRIEMGFGTFSLAIFLSLIVALGTVTWQSVKAALANPVDSLRSE